MQCVRFLPVAAGLIVLSMGPGCATTSDPGWTGRHATGFGSAQAVCEAEAMAADSDAERTALFEGCMLRNGWSRGVD